MISFASIRTLLASGMSVKSVLTSRLTFCVASALLMVALRLLIFDYPVFFKMQFVPNHDMYQGAPFFVTSGHSVRLTGEIAWWNAMSNNGYAQYYQSFSSPLAPTSHHIVVIIWAQGIRLLSFLKIHVPEYFQFLIITYIVFPFLAFLSFSLFASQIFRRRATIFLVLTVYVFSGIGLWNSAWFFFQEPFTLFLLLAALIAALKRPTARRLLLLLAALVIQLTSINYWTVYNFWFALILTCAYCWAYPVQVRRLFVRAKQLVGRHKIASAAVIISFALVVTVWLIIIGSIVAEQSGNYISGVTGRPGGYSIEEAQERVQGLRTYTTELFNPEVRRALNSYKIYNEMHNARYIGAFLLPLLVLIPATFWRRRERWLIVSAVGVLIVCLAPPFLLYAWKATPFMDKVRHVFYFYTQYWQLLVLLLAGTSMDMLLARAYDAASRRRFLVLVSGLCVVLLLLLAGYLSFSHLFPANDRTLQANIRFALLALVSGVVIVQMLLFPSRKSRQIFMLVICALALTDLTWYFREVSFIDKRFTETRWPVASPLPENVRAALRRPWPDPGLSNGFKSDLYANMPVSNVLWYDTVFMNHRYLLELRELPEEFQQRELHQEPLGFYTQAKILEQGLQPSEVLKNVPEAFKGNELLLLQPDAGQVMQQPANVGTAVDGFKYQWREWRYNDFRFEIDAPQDGWLLIRQMNDPLWRVSVDGQKVVPVRANFTGMAIYVKAGRHDVSMSYRPLARSLYWPGALMLEATLLALLFLSAQRKAGQYRLR